MTLEIVETNKPTRKSLEKWYNNIKGLDLPIVLEVGYSAKVRGDDLREWVKRTFLSEADQEKFWECFGVNTVSGCGHYLCDVDNALAAMNGKAFSWD